LGRLQLLLVWQRLEWTWLLLVWLPMALRLRLGRRLWVERLALVRGVVAGGVVAHGTAAVAIGMVAAVAGMAEAEDITTNAVGAVPAEHHRRQAKNVFPDNDHEKRNYTESLKV
jgi:hypothetical protein